MDQALNVGFFVFHTAWVLFNCLGWIWRSTRTWQVVTLSLTAFSWFALGAWFGWGYCPCTDWHWQVRARLGHQDPPSYIQLIVRELTGVELSVLAANAIAVTSLAGSAALGIGLTLRDSRRAKEVA
jgi:hypothetical protein